MTGIEETGGVESCSLLYINPNSAFSMFSVNFSISESALIELLIFDMSGRLVRQSPATIYSSGLHQVNYSDLATGLYICRMTADDFIATQQFVAIK